MKSTRVYVVIPTWGLQDGVFDTNNFFINQALAMQKVGYNPLIIAVRLLSIKSARSLKLCRLNNAYEHHGMKVRIYDLYVPIPSKFNALRDRYISKHYQKILHTLIREDEENADFDAKLIHAHVSHESAYYCLEAAATEKLPLVVTEHYSGLLSGAASEADYARAKQTIECSDRFIFVGSNFKNYLCDKLNIQKNVLVIPNMINRERYTIRKETHDTFCFLTAGTLKKIKSMDLVIRAFGEEFAKDEPVRLLIAGDGVERSHLENLVDELGEKDRITFYGEYQIDEAGQIFSQSDAFVLTGKFETFGIVYVEAQFCGLPCIGTEGQGADDSIDDTNGFLVPYGNISRLRRAMRHLYRESASYSKEEIRRRAVERFSEESVAKRLANIYEELTGGMDDAQKF